MNFPFQEHTVGVQARPGQKSFLLTRTWDLARFSYYPWLVIALCACFLFFKYVLQVSPSVMTNDLMREFSVNGAGLGNLAATYFYAYLFIQILAGPLLDRYSPRYLTTIAIGLCALASFAFAYAHTILLAGLARALMGAGTAFATISYMKMSALWFPTHRVAFVDGLLATAAMVGAVCGQIPLALLVNHIGWRDSLICCGFFGAALAVLFLLFARDRHPTTVGRALSPCTGSHLPKWHDVLVLFKDKRNWLLTFYSGLAFTPVAVLGGLWGNPFFEVEHHLTATKAASFTSLIFLGLAIGGPLFGFFADCLGKRIKAMIVGTLLALVSLLLVIYVSTLPLWLFGSLLFLFGLGTGVFMLSYPLGKELNHFGLAATVVALINTGDALFGSFTEPLIGKVLDLFWQGKTVNGVHFFATADYHIALSLLPVYLFVGLGCLMVLRKL